MYRAAAIAAIVAVCSAAGAATRTSTQSGNWNDTATWGGAAAPGDGDIAIIASPDIVTVTADVTIGSKASGVGHAVQIQGSDAATYGKLIVNDGVTLTLKGFGTSSNTLMQIDRYALFEPAAGATIVGDVAADFGACIRNKGRFEAIGTLAKPITFTVPSANVNWNSAVTSQAATCSPYSVTDSLSLAVTGSPHIANAAGDGPGSFGDSSLTINSSTPSLSTEVATLAAVDAAGEYWVDYDMGVVYFHTTTFTGLALNASYKKLDLTAANWRGWGIVSDGNTANTTCLIDHCNFRYMGAAGNGLLVGSIRKSAPVCMGYHQTADSTRLAYVKNSTFDYGFQWVHLDSLTGASGDPILVEGNDFNEQSGGSTWSGLSPYAAGASDYIQIDGNDFHTRATAIDLANMVGDLSHLEVSNNTGVCGLAFIAGGTGGGRSPFLRPVDTAVVGTTPSLHVHDNVISGIASGVDGRFVCISGTAAGPAIFEDNTIQRCGRLGHLLGSYVTFRRNTFAHSYHHGFTGSQTDDLYCTDTRFENNLFINDGGSLSGSSGIALGYNHRDTHDDVEIANNTCVGWWYGLLDYNDVVDSNGPGAFSNVRCIDNIVTGGAYGFASYTSATIPLSLHVVEADHNLVYGQSTGYATTQLANTTKGTGFWRSGPVKYNRETSATRNLPFVAIFDANYTTNQSARTLTHTVNTLGQDHTLTWGGGTPVQLIYDYGTSAGEGYRTVAVAGKSGWITNRNSVRTNWLWVVSGTGAGQCRRINWTSTYTGYAVSIVSGGTSWSVGQKLAVSGGTTDTPGAYAILEVASVSSGVITGLKIVSGGGYTATPSNPCSTSRLTGTAGGSCTVNMTWDTGVMVIPPLETAVDNTSVVAIVKGMVTLGDSGSGTVKAGLYLPDPSDWLNAMQMGTTTQSDTGITVEVDNTLYVDPQYVASGSAPDYYYLGASSPAIDAGTSDDAATTDWLGTARPQGSGYDMGFYEKGSAAKPHFYFYQPLGRSF